MGLRKINTIGIKQANKVVQMSTCAYNLKKQLKFIKGDLHTKAQSAQAFVNRLVWAYFSPMPEFTCVAT